MKLGYGLVVEDVQTVSRGMRAAMMLAFPGIAVDEAPSLRAARQFARSARYDIMLVDLGLPDGSGIDFIREVTDAKTGARIVVTSVFDDESHIFPALAAGAVGYLLKEQNRETLARHLLRLEAGVPPLSPAIARKLLTYFQTEHIEQIPTPPEVQVHLSPRETEVLSLIGRGLRVSEAASVLGLTENTVASYVKEIYRKLNICSRAEAALEASRRGLL